MKYWLCYNMDTPWKHRLSERNLKQKVTCYRFHLYGISRIGKATETESRWVTTRGWGKGGLGGGRIGNDCLMSTGFSFGVMKCFGTRRRRWLHNFANIPNATELYTLKKLILCEFHISFLKREKKTHLRPLLSNIIRFRISLYVSEIENNTSAIN